MTSEMATASETSSILQTAANETDYNIADVASEVADTKCNDKDSKPIVTFGPITDKKIAVVKQNALDATNNATNCSSFQRSASLRLRGTKSNLLLQATRNSSSRGGSNTSSSSLDRTECMKMEHGVLSANTPTALAATEASATGRNSLRRTFALSSHNYEELNRLTRSFSLRRNFKARESDKTDASKETCSLSTADSCDTLKDAEINALEGEFKTNVGIKDPLEKYGKMTETEVAARAVDESLNVNGELTTALTTGRATGTGTATTTVARTTTQSLVRPATLATAKIAGLANGSIPNYEYYSKTKVGSARAVNTPKTPTTTALQQPNYSQHNTNCTHYAKCCNQSKSTLANVSEATSTSTKPTPKTPPVTPDSPSTYLEDDLDSMYSFATTTSGRSTMSCEHPYVARNGTTFSGRKMKYVVHCSNYAGQVGPDYLTPTQRAQRQLRRLKELLCAARQDLEQKDSEIMRLTREVVELRLFKASLSSPEERSASSDAITVREAELKTSQDVSPIVDMVDDTAKGSPRHAHTAVVQHNQQLNQQNVMQLSAEMQSSYADSGHFEDMTSLSVHSKDSYVATQTQDIACGSDEADADANTNEIAAAAAADACENFELQRQKLILMYEQRIEELIRNQDAVTSDIKHSHNDRVEALLHKLAECNTRYADIVPDYEHAKERIRELEKQLEDLQRKLAEHEEKQNKMYLHMYQQGQEAERIAHVDQALELAHRAPNNKVSINELLQQLQSTQDELENIRTIYRRLLEAQKNRAHVDPEVTLQFLKSAIYYFLTDKENSQGHLQAIESILEFTETEKQNISKARMPK